MTDKLTAIRDQLPAVQAVAFLNTGTCGPLPAPAAQAIAAVTEEEYRQGRASTLRYLKMLEDKAAARAALAALFHVEPESIALTHHTTEGMNIATLGLDWQPGDEVATTTLEHEAGIYPLYIIQSRFGVRINFADVRLGADPLDAIDAALTPRTRLLSISHVSYSSGTRFPLAEVVALAHSKGVPVLVDGAQSAGVFELDLKALDVDFYAVPGQKWLCGPEGTGALYVRPDHLETLRVTFPSFGSLRSHDWRDNYTLTPDASRYETGTLYPATVAGLQASLQWFRDVVGPAWAYRRIAALSAYTRQALEALEGVRLLTPAGCQASLVNFLPVGWSPARMAGLVSALAEQGYIIRSIPHEPYCVRVSCGFYNTEAEIDGLCQALARLLAAGPESVAIPAWASQRQLSDKPVTDPLAA